MRSISMARPHIKRRSIASIRWAFCCRFVEWVFIFIPILFHATIGFIIIAGMMPNTAAYPYNGNIRYTLQRATGMIVFAFIVCT